MSAGTRGGFRWILSVAAAFLLLLHPAGAIFVHQDVRDVPVDRLVANLEALVVNQPSVVQHRVNLARVHAMAFALKSESLTVLAGKESAGPTNTPLSENVQPEVKRTSDPRKLADARRHLAQAVRRYEEAIQMDPQNPLARLGYAWSLQQAGETTKAIAAYRAAIEVAWPQERRGGPVRFHGWISVTEEASRHLIPLLDPVKDRDEISQLRSRAEELERRPRAITPIAIPLRDGLGAGDLSDERAAVSFDADGSGLQRRWTWITADAGWLVFDARRQGTVRSALQMFGSVTFWLFWNTGYDAMRALDDDGDGRLRGRELEGLAVWRDVDGDAVSDPGEVLPLAHWQIVELSCGYEIDPSHPDEIPISRLGMVLASGAVRPTYDLLLRPK